MHVGGELDELSVAAQAAQRGELPERPALVVGQQSRYDRSRAPGDAETLYVYGHVPAGYAQDDEVDRAVRSAARALRARIRRRIVRARSARSPVQSERENPSLVGGDLAGGSYELDQQLVFRPAPELARYRTPLRGLYVAGASTHPGGAVHGISGRAAARALLSDRRLRPWR